MKTLLFIVYLIGFVVTFIAWRKNRIKNKDWIVQQLLMAILFSIFNPCLIIGFVFYKILTWNFWDKNLPKWL